jgi:hypothetical protein
LVVIMLVDTGLDATPSAGWLRAVRRPLTVLVNL